MANAPAPSTTAASTTAAPFLLDRTPPEIRNRIYELVIEPEVLDTVDILQAKPPSKALLLTCRQVYNEARLIHQDAHRKFWSCTRFTLTLDYPPGSQRNQTIGALIAGDDIDQAQLSKYGWVGGISNEDLSHITKLSMYQVSENGEDDKTPVYLENGVWCSSPGTVEDFGFMLMPVKAWDAMQAAGYRTLKLGHFKTLIFSKKPAGAALGGHAECGAFAGVWIRGEYPGGHRFNIKGVEMEPVKKIAGKGLLTRGEVLAILAWVTDGAVTVAAKDW